MEEDKYYDISNGKFVHIIEMLEDEGLIKGSVIVKGGRDLNRAKINFKGLEYLEKNSTLSKTYKGLKEIRDWLPL